MTIIKNSLADKIEEYKAASNAATEAVALSTKLYTEVDKSIRTLIDRTLREFSLECSVNVQFHFNKRTPEGAIVVSPHFSIPYLIDVSNERSALLSNKRFVNIGGKWIHTKHHTYKNVYMHDLDFHTPLKNVNLNHLAEACAILTEKTGAPVEHDDYAVVKANGRPMPKTEADLLTYHPASRVVASGMKYHEGWDNGDPWAVVQTRKGNLMVYYSTNGQGFGYDMVVESNKSVVDFYQWLLDGGTNVSRLQSFIPANVLKKLDERGP